MFFHQLQFDFLSVHLRNQKAQFETSKSPKIQKIHNRVRNVKRSEKVGVKLMQAWEERYYDKLEAREEGLAEGREEGIFKVVENMLKNNLPMQTIIDCSGV